MYKNICIIIELISKDFKMQKINKTFNKLQKKEKDAKIRIEEIYNINIYLSKTT